MTLTRSPCELDNMSLFQNLKLKRGKVDSRCSSDGKNAPATYAASHTITVAPQSKARRINTSLAHTQEVAGRNEFFRPGSVPY